ncbi:MAG: aldehyde dehydrogenase family protein [Geobacteraceae bacterium]|nr:aldehyde dehydrogenase family protein [Geobacteraceae bacterium]
MVRLLASFDPSNGKLLGEVQVISPEQVTNLAARAHDAAMRWRKLDVTKRVSILEKAYAQAGSRINELAVLLSREMGKDIRRSTGEVNWVIHGGPQMAQSAREALLPRNLDRGTRLEYQPLGVVAVISPWNYPLAMANNYIVPSLVAGNSVVFKPSEETPLIAQAFVDIMNECLPPHLLQIVHGDGEQGRTLVESDVNMIAFTGSQAVGKQIMARASGQLKRLVMELGGNDPMIVLHDADIERAARFAVANSFENAGQMCIATERIYVDEKIAEQFEQMVTELASSYKVGPWDMAGVNIGPIINAKQHLKIVEHIRDAEVRGARVLLGGSNQPERYIHPTVICDMTPDMLLEQEETFGPVVAISRYADIGEAILRANASTYGLGAVVFGGKEAEAVADQLEAGMIGINQGVGGSGDAPWVGAKQSGFGFHGSSDGHRQFAQIRVVSLLTD